MLALAPLRSGVTFSGSLVLLVDPIKDFSELLSVGRISHGSESYAINRNGQMVSASRFENELRQVGLLDSRDWVSSIINVEVRDPGIDLSQPGATTAPRASQPLTTMASEVLRGGSGSNLQGYRNYRGIPVIGAWQWLDDFDMGLAVEMPIDEAMRPGDFLRRMMYGLLGIVAVSALGLGALAWQYRQSMLQGKKTEGRQLGQYTLNRGIGSGGMGTVYLGQHQFLRRDVAIKVLEGKDLSKRAVSRFEREVQATARLRHPNTVAIYDYGFTDEGAFFYVMEWVDGISLQQLITDYGRQPPERIIYLLLQVCGSLAEAHHKGIIHRDIKPANIMIAAHAGLYDSVKLLDFGLVKDLDNEDTLLTVTDSFTGTPSFMSPEAVRDASSVDHRSDIYALGAVAYMLLTGVPVFEGGTAVEVCVKQINEEPIRPSERIGTRLPEDLQNVIMSCLRKFPDERPRNISELAETLQHCADASRWSIGEARRWWVQVYQAAEPKVIADDQHDTLVGISKSSQSSLASHRTLETDSRVTSPNSQSRVN
jgi:serine/threonine-protein kinase